MNCERVKRLSLLLESGEATERQRRKTEKHLNECAACAEFAARARWIVAAAERRHAAVRGPSPFVMTRIRAHAREALERQPVFVQRPLVRAALAAGLAAVLLAGWWALRPAPQGISERHLDEVQALVEILSDSEVAIAGEQARSQDEQLRDLARRLLEMEGLADDEVSVEEWLAPSPTVPQSHNSGARRFRTHV